MAKANDIINVARSWIGYNEYNGSFRKIIDIYNSHKPLARGYAVKYSDEWCATFVSAVAIQAKATNIIPTECGCEKQIELFRKLGSWIDDESITPLPGDIIYYDWQDSGNGNNTGFSDHVGIVESVGNGIVTVIEGNNSESVRRRTISVNGRYIRGYARPKYDKTTTPPLDYSTVTKIAKEVIAGNWGNGAERKSRLTNAGYDYNTIQARVNELVYSGSNGKKSNIEIAKEVIAGNWGNGAERKSRLTNAGYDYYEVQKIVNTMV